MDDPKKIPQLKISKTVKKNCSGWFANPNRDNRSLVIRPKNDGANFLSIQKPRHQLVRCLGNTPGDTDQPDTIDSSSPEQENLNE